MFLDERKNFDEQFEHLQRNFDQIFLDFQENFSKKTSNNERKNEQLHYFIKRTEDFENSFRDLTQIQRALTKKSHRIDLQRFNQLKINIKHFQSQCENELERHQRLVHQEKEFLQLEKQFQVQLDTIEEQLESFSNLQDKTFFYQVR